MIISETEKFAPSIYKKISQDKLILVAILIAIERDGHCTFGRLVEISFNMFPEVFCLQGYPNWPDTIKYDQPLSTLRKKGEISGGTRSYFKLSEFGRQKAFDTLRILRKNKDLANCYSERIQTKPNENLLKSVRESDVFKRFIKFGENCIASESELRAALKCTLETPNKDLKYAIGYFKELAKNSLDNEIVNFIDFCEKLLIKRVHNG